MNKERKKVNVLKIIITIIGIIIISILVQKGIKVLSQISQICVVEYGNLKYEENANAYILREEQVLQGENYKNGMVQIIPEGQRVAKGEPVFRYYSNGEEEILNKIAILDDEINADIESSGLTIFSTDITNLENQIQQLVDSMHEINKLEDLEEKKSELDTYITKKTKITGNLSPSDSHVRTLIEQRNALEEQLNTDSEIITATVAGTVSYRLDGLEEILGIEDFSYLSTEFLESLDTKANAIIGTNTEKGKIINNFNCYIACTINTERASVAQIGDKVTIRLPSSDEVDATIEYIVKEDGDNRVLVLKITEDVEELIQYREIMVDIIWWSYSGLKVSNSAILEENDINYVERSKAGYIEKIYVKISRQNDTYSIVENYTDDELMELGFDDEFLENRNELNVYDEILLH